MTSTKVIYLDSSIVLGHLLREKEVEEWAELEGERWTSELTEIECRRTLDRIRLHERMPDTEIADRLMELEILLKSLRIIRLNTTILKRAKAPYPTVVRSLDAIHLASAELVKTRLFLTRDKQQAVAAKAIGLEVPS